MRYAKLIEGALQYAPNPIRLNGEDVFTTDPRPYGYKPVVSVAPVQQEGCCAVSDGWEETESEIRQKWRFVPVPDEAGSGDYEAALSRLGVET